MWLDVTKFMLPNKTNLRAACWSGSAESSKKSNLLSAGFLD